MTHWMARLAGGLAAILLSAGAASAAPDQATIETGQLAGVVDHDVVSFKGIPFAKPPVGDLRWRAPQPVEPWTGVRAADKYGALCMQKINTKDNGVGPPPASEDCLTLNVWKPLHPSKRALPVMVWIHGGGLVNGSGTAALYDGSAFARRDVVLVTINYRLGRFGFFAHPALTAETPNGPLGNYGLMDQIAALRWVQRNIAAFNGDPRDVTVFGESAGGVSVNHLMLAPAARGLFIRAIVESGVGRETSAPLHVKGPGGVPSAEDQGQAFVARLGLTGDSAAALRAIPADVIIAAGDPDMTKSELIVIDGVTQTMEVADGFRQGLEMKIPYIVGSNSLELPVPPSMIDTFFGGAGHMSAADKAKMAQAYGGMDAFNANVLSDIVFTEPAHYLAQLHAANGNPTWLYRFSVLSPTAPKMLKGAPHASEREYVFDTLDASPWPTVEADKPLAAEMNAYWADFAKHSDPNGDHRPHWPRYEAASDELLDFTNTGPVAEKTPRANVLKALAARYPQ